MLATDQSLTRLIDMTNETCLIALDKTLIAIRLAQRRGYGQMATYVGSIAERIIRAAFEVGRTLPQELRACSHSDKL